MSGPSPLDHFAIQNTIARYCVALDTKDFALLDEVFVHDVHAKYPFRDAMNGCEAVKEAIQGRLGDVVTQHALTTQIVEITPNGETASATTYFTGSHFGHGKYDGQVLTAYGRYVDHLVCTGSGAWGYRDWRIKKREVLFTKRIGDERIMDH